MAATARPSPPWGEYVGTDPVAPVRIAPLCDKRGLEGIVSKRRYSAYRSGKQASWIKVKCQPWREANRNRHKLFRGK